MCTRKMFFVKQNIFYDKDWGLIGIELFSMIKIGVL
jgi:hypothetical protein